MPLRNSRWSPTGSTRRRGARQGMIVNAVTKSGTNSFAGTFGGYFQRRQVQRKGLHHQRVLPYSNQQVSTTFGGPIRRDRVHFFGAYEYEREPKTYYYRRRTQLQREPGVPDAGRTNARAARLSVHPQTRLSTRVSDFNNIFYAGGGATTHPSAGGTRERRRRSTTPR